jgi:hypothetical protein
MGLCDGCVKVPPPSAVKLGRQNPDMYEVLEGLQPGDRVVTSRYNAFNDADELIIAVKRTYDRCMWRPAFSRPSTPNSSNPQRPEHMSLLRTTALSKVYRTDTVETTALNAVDITIAQGEFVAIMGQAVAANPRCSTSSACWTRPAAATTSLTART